MFARRARAAALRRSGVEAKGRSYAKQRALSNKILQAPQNLGSILLSEVSVLLFFFEKGSKPRSKEAKKLRNFGIQQHRKNTAPAPAPTAAWRLLEEAPT